MQAGRRRDRLLLIPAGMMLVSALIVFGVLFYVEANPGYEFGGLIFFGGVTAVLSPVFFAGFVWMLIALLMRRPLRRDPVGWVMWVPLLVVSAVLTMYGLTLVGVIAPYGRLSGDISSFTTFFVLMTTFGILGLAATMGSLIPKRAHRGLRGSQRPEAAGTTPPTEFTAERPQYQAIELDVASSKTRTIIGILLVMPLAVEAVFFLLTVVEYRGGGSPWYLVLSVPASLLYFLIDPYTWIYVGALWVAGRFFKARQQVSVSDGFLQVRTTGAFPPAFTRRIDVGTSGPYVRVLRYGRDSRNPDYRPTVLPRLAVGSGLLSTVRFATGLTASDAGDLAAVLNAMIAEAELPAASESSVWRLAADVG